MLLHDFELTDVFCAHGEWNVDVDHLELILNSPVNVLLGDISLRTSRQHDTARDCARNSQATCCATLVGRSQGRGSLDNWVDREKLGVGGGDQ